MQPARHAGYLFQLFVQPDRVPLKRRHVGVAVQGVESPRSVPGAARGQFGPFDQHDVLPAQFCEMVQDRSADNAAPDNDSTCGGFHGAVLLSGR